MIKLGNLSSGFLVAQKLLQKTEFFTELAHSTLKHSNLERRPVFKLKMSPDRRKQKVQRIAIPGPFHWQSFFFLFSAVVGVSVIH